MAKRKNLPVYEHTQPNGENYYTFPNQKEVGMVRPKLKPPFSSVERECKYKAMNMLSGGGYKLWSYFIDSKNGRRIGLSHRDVGNMTGISKSTYDRAVKELIEKGFLIQYKDTSYYYFVTDNDMNGMELEEYIEWCNSTYSADEDDE